MPIRANRGRLNGARTTSEKALETAKLAGIYRAVSATSRYRPCLSPFPTRSPDTSSSSVFLRRSRAETRCSMVRPITMMSLPLYRLLVASGILLTRAFTAYHLRTPAPADPCEGRWYTYPCSLFRPSQAQIVVPRGSAVVEVVAAGS